MEYEPTPPPTPDEALASLAEAAREKNRARGLYRRFSGSIFVIWGSIYALAYGAGCFWAAAEAIWLPLVLAGFALSFWLGSRMGSFLRSSTGRTFRNLWAAFGAAYFLLSWGFAGIQTPEYLFSFVINLFIAYALLASAAITAQPTLFRASVVLALIDTLFFSLAPAWYCPAMAALGILAVVTGLGMVRSRAL
ncbi:hypothetical protein [Oceanithermus sp.]